MLNKLITWPAFSCERGLGLGTVFHRLRYHSGASLPPPRLGRLVPRFKLQQLRHALPACRRYLLAPQFMCGDCGEACRACLGCLMVALAARASHFYPRVPPMAGFCIAFCATAPWQRKEGMQKSKPVAATMICNECVAACDAPVGNFALSAATCAPGPGSNWRERLHDTDADTGETSIIEACCVQLESLLL